MPKKFHAWICIKIPKIMRLRKKILTFSGLFIEYASVLLYRVNWLGYILGTDHWHIPPSQFEENKWHIKFYDTKYLKLLTFHYFYKSYILMCFTETKKLRTLNIFTIYKIYKIFLWNIKFVNCALQNNFIKISLKKLWIIFYFI